MNTSHTFEGVNITRKGQSDPRYAKDKHMAENETKVRVDYAVLGTIKATWVARVNDEAKINADPSQGIMEDVTLPFSKPVFNVDNATEASNTFEKLGAAVFNGLLNYAADLKIRARVVGAKRAELTSDPYKKDAKRLEGLGFNDTQIANYTEYRKAGLDSQQALAKVITS